MNCLLQTRIVVLKGRIARNRLGAEVFCTGNSNYGGGAVAADNASMTLRNAIVHANTAAEPSAPGTLLIIR